MKGHPVAVHEVTDFPLGKKNIGETRVFGDEEAVSIRVGLNPTYDNLGLRGKGVMPAVEFDNLALSD
jgi:hypothetical protein